MLAAFLSTLGGLVANKKILAGWLILLSLATAQIGEKAYASRGADKILETKIDAIKETLGKIDANLIAHGVKLDQLLVEQARLRAEMDLQLERKGR